MTDDGALPAAPVAAPRTALSRVHVVAVPSSIATGQPDTTAVVPTSDRHLLADATADTLDLRPGDLRPGGAGSPLRRLNRPPSRQSR